MFSRRTLHESEPNALSVALHARRAAGLEVCDLTQSNPTLTDLPYDAERLLAALAGPESRRYEPAAFGMARARGAVSELLRSSGFEVPSAQILLTSSTS